jgi:hypothetical protein
VTAPAQMRHAATTRTCHIPWCLRDDPDTGTHGSRCGRAEDVSVMLIAYADHPPALCVSCRPYPLGQARQLASLLSYLGHAELAALVTSTAALAGGAS